MVRRPISPFRALLTAHLQAALNRSRRELGKGGTAAMVLILVILVPLALIPALAGSGALGYVLGKALAKPMAGLFLGALLAVLSLGAGVLGGVAGGTQALTWESYRTFPLRFRTLFAAELLAGLGDLMPLLMALMQACLLLGFGLSQPRALLLLPFLWAMGVLLMLAVQHLVGSLAAVVVKRLKAGLVVLGVLLWMATVLVPMTLGPAGKARNRAERQAAGAREAEMFAQWGERVGRWRSWSDLTPHGQAVLGLEAAAQGRPLKGLLHLLPLGITVLAALAATAKVLRWEGQPEALRASTSGPGPRLWSFRTPLAGLARLSWETVLGSHLGKFGFLMPLFTLVLVKGPFAHLGKPGLWAIPGAFAYLSLTGSQMLYNQFGLYGAGIKALLLLPLRPRDLLAGQMLGLAAYQGVQALVLTGLLFVLGSREVIPLLAGLALGLALFLVQAAVGSFTSSAMPRLMPRDSLKSGGMPVLLVLINLGTILGAGGLLGGLYALCAWAAPAWLLPVMLLVAAGTAGLYVLLLPLAATLLAERRDQLVEVLG